MNVSNTYKNQQVVQLTEREQCRKKLPIFFGDFSNYQHSLREILLNSRDEVINNYDTGTIHIKLYEDNETIEVLDSGRGINLWGETDGQPNYFLLLQKLWAGGNHNNLELGIASTGTNSVGLTCTNYCAELFEVTSYKNFKFFKATYKDGGELVNIEQGDNLEIEHGTRVKFKQDKTIYTKTRFDEKEVEEICLKISSTSPQIKYVFEYNGKIKEFQYDSQEEYLRDNVINNLTQFIQFKEKQYEEKIKIDAKDYIEKDSIVCNLSLSTEPLIETFLNGTWLIEGGSILDGIIDGIKKFVQKDIKDKKIKLSPQDILMSFNVHCLFTSTNPSFSGQTKFSSASPLYKKLASQYMVENLEIFKHENPKIYQQIIEHITKINGLNAKSEDTIKNLKKKLTEKSTGNLKKIKNLIECQCKDRTKNILCICEGKSSLSSILSGRTETQAIFPLRGKILNCLKASDEKIYKNDVILGLLESLGADVIVEKGRPKIIFPPEKLRYSKVYIMVDFDFDGIGSILPLLLTVFYKLMPQLIREGRIYLCETPKYEIVINKTEEELYAFNDEQLEEVLKGRDKRTYTLHYIKGLAELSEKSISLCLSGEMGNAKQLLMGNIEKTIDELNLWMGDDVEPRKKYIMEHYNDGEVLE